jgi:hypothetical protein
LPSRTNNASVKVGGGEGVDGGSGGDVVLVGGGADVGGGGVLVDGVAVSTARAEGVKVCPVVGAALGAMVGAAVGGGVAVADGIGM